MRRTLRSIWEWNWFAAVSSYAVSLAWVIDVIVRGGSWRWLIALLWALGAIAPTQRAWSRHVEQARRRRSVASVHAP